MEEVYTSIHTDFDIIIAIDSLTLGPALGGCRIQKYKDISAAKEDAKKLSKGMTYKNSLAGLDLGGGKAVINLRTTDADSRMKALETFANLINTLNGKYITAEDVGSTLLDMLYLKSFTEHVIADSDFNPSAFTALGVLYAIKAAVKYRFDVNDISNFRIGIQGVGKVGKALCKLLVNSGARVIVTDTNPDALMGSHLRDVKVIPEESKFFDQPMDIYAPCALGGTLNWYNINKLVSGHCVIVCGSANNQLALDFMAQYLYNKRIIYIPDYLANAGGVITINAELGHITKKELYDEISTIYDRTLKLLKKSSEDNRLTIDIANYWAEKRLKS